MFCLRSAAGASKGLHVKRLYVNMVACSKQQVAHWEHTWEHITLGDPPAATEDRKLGYRRLAF